MADIDGDELQRLVGPLTAYELRIWRWEFSAEELRAFQGLTDEELRAFQWQLTDEELRALSAPPIVSDCSQ